jgi:hypothetical protein
MAGARRRVRALQATGAAPDDAQAQALGTEWMVKLVRDTGAHPGLFARLNAMHAQEPAMRQTTSIDADVMQFILAAFNASRMALYRPFLDAQEYAYLLANYGKRSGEWPALIAAVRAAMDARTPPTDPAVLQLARQWLELFRSYAGTDPATQLKFRQAHQQEPRLMEGSFVDSAMLQYLGAAMAWWRRSGPANKLTCGISWARPCRIGHRPFQEYPMRRLLLLCLSLPACTSPWPPMRPCKGYGRAPWQGQYRGLLQPAQSHAGGGPQRQLLLRALQDAHHAVHAERQERLERGRRQGRHDGYLVFACAAGRQGQRHLDGAEKRQDPALALTLLEAAGDREHPSCASDAYNLALEDFPNTKTSKPIAFEGKQYRNVQVGDTITVELIAPGDGVAKINAQLRAVLAKNKKTWPTSMPRREYWAATVSRRKTKCMRSRPTGRRAG